MHFIWNEIGFPFIASYVSWDVLSFNLLVDSSAEEMAGIESVYPTWLVHYCSRINNGKDSKGDFNSANPALAAERALSVFVCVSFWFCEEETGWGVKKDSKYTSTCDELCVHTSLSCAPEIHGNVLSSCSGNCFQDNWENLWVHLCCDIHCVLCQIWTIQNKNGHIFNGLAEAGHLIFEQGFFCLKCSVNLQKTEIQKRCVSGATTSKHLRCFHAEHETWVQYKAGILKDLSCRRCLQAFKCSSCDAVSLCNTITSLLLCTVQPILSRGNYVYILVICRCKYFLREMACWPDYVFN